MTTATAPSSSSRVQPNQWHAFGGICRLALRRYALPGHWIAMAVMLGILVLLGFAALPAGRDNVVHYSNWARAFYLGFVVPLLAFVSAAGAMRDEMKSSSIDYVLTRPVPRRWFVLFRYVAHLLCAQVDFLVALGVVVGLGIFRQVPTVGMLVPWFLLAQVLLVTAFSALGFLAGTITSRYVVLGLAYGGIIEVGVGQIPTAINRLSLIRQVQMMLRSIFEAGLPVTADAPTATVGGTLLLVLIFSTVVLAGAATIFSLREFAGSGEA
jgi:ABC-2 type transport system permease protein